jgi:HEAT repeat protein
MTRTKTLSLMAASLLLYAGGCGNKKTSVSRNQPTMLRSSIRPTRRRAGKQALIDGDVAALLKNLHSKDIPTVWAAEENLGNLGSRVAAQVRTVLTSRSLLARAAGCRLAYKFDDKLAVPYLIDLLLDKARLVRIEAGSSLTGLTEKKFNYRFDANLTDRRAAHARWSAWYRRAHPAPRRRRR